MVYLDNAATSFPKPPQVALRMAEYVTEIGATVNRSVYGAAQQAGLVTLRLRERLCRLLGYGGRPTHAVLTSGCTMSLNMVLQGYLQPGDHCIVSALEHNAVMRPLTAMGVEFDRIPCDSQGLLDLDVIPGLIRPNTRLLVMAHGSNVCGAVQDAAAVGKLCKLHGIAFVLDAAQTAGHIPVDFDGFGCDAMAVPAHKGLLGPSGLGALLMTKDFARKLRPLITGGTGSASHTEIQPDFMPDKFEPGTPNLPGIYGWEAALAWLEEQTVERIRHHDLALSRQFLQGLAGMENVRLIGPTDPRQRVAVFSLDFSGQDNALVGDRLEQEFGILTRCGLHCAPNAHKVLGTYPGGTVRLSFGCFNSQSDVEAALHAIGVVTK
jgi:cysteine desulfurase family protein